MLLNFSVKILFVGKKTRIILQNPDDRAVLVNAKIINKKNKSNFRCWCRYKFFHYKNIPNENVPIVMLSARMLWPKGNDFVTCSSLINHKNINAKFVLVGNPDYQNPDSVPLQKLKKWNASGLIEWWGHQENMVQVYHQASVVCLSQHMEKASQSHY